MLLYLCLPVSLFLLDYRAIPSCPPHNNLTLDLRRPWKYNPDIKEYFVETVTKQTIKQSEMRKRTEITDLGEPFQQIRLDIDPLSS